MLDISKKTDILNYTLDEISGILSAETHNEDTPRWHHTVKPDHVMRNQMRLTSFGLRSQSMIGTFLCCSAHSCAFLTVVGHLSCKLGDDTNCVMLFIVQYHAICTRSNFGSCFVHDIFCCHISEPSCSYIFSVMVVRAVTVI
jgi:hypothetical protein